MPALPVPGQLASARPVPARTVPGRPDPARPVPGQLHDHRKLGRELDLFDTDPLIGAGLPYLRPAGAVIRHELEEYVRDLERRAGYQHVCSPVIAKRELYEVSGHSDHYRDGMYPPMDIGGEQVVLRPSLCPHHVVIYRSRAHSYRELPLRLAELGGMYRSELSGVLGGLARVRSIQLNDAHIFCAPEQVAGEAAAALALIQQAHQVLGIQAARYRLSLAGSSDKYAGRRELWDRASAVLRDVLDSASVPYQAEEGEAAFYGPKIDVQVADSSEREVSLATVQVDFYLPDRFGLEYIGPDGRGHQPVMVHRSVIGSLERMLAHLVDVHGGAFPPWLAPVQLVVLPVGDDQVAPARAVLGAAIDHGLRAGLASDGSLRARIRAHRFVPYQAVIGEAEATARDVSLRLRDGQKLPAMPAAEMLERVAAQVRARSQELWRS